jgi:hypothetical protein
MRLNGRKFKLVETNEQFEVYETNIYTNNVDDFYRQIKNEQELLTMNFGGDPYNQCSYIVFMVGIWSYTINAPQGNWMNEKYTKITIYKDLRD